MSATTSVALLARGPIVSSFGRTCSTIAAALSRNVVGYPLLSSLSPHLPVPQPRSAHGAVASVRQVRLDQPPGEFVVKRPVRVVVDAVVSPRDAVVIFSAGIGRGTLAVAVTHGCKCNGRSTDTGDLCRLAGEPARRSIGKVRTGVRNIGEQARRLNECQAHRAATDDTTNPLSPMSSGID